MISNNQKSRLKQTSKMSYYLFVLFSMGLIKGSDRKDIVVELRMQYCREMVYFTPPYMRNLKIEFVHLLKKYAP